MILDTCFLVDIMKNDVNAVKKLKELVHSQTRLFTTTPTIYELFSGIAQSAKPAPEKEKVVRILQEQTLLSLDEVSAKTAGILDGTLIKQGTVIDPIDTLIAGIALRHGEIVLTRNKKHFSRVEGLQVESY